MLSVSGLNVWYGPTEVLRKVDFTVEPGQTIALLGGNGSGKSTVVNAICGMVRPRGGEISWSGTNIAGWRPDLIVRAGIVQVPQGREVFASMTVRENLEIGAHTRAADKNWKNDIDEMFELFPVLAEKRNDVAILLSGGEQQQLSIARALMAKPKLLLMDEPTVGLSPLMVDRTIETILMLRKRGLTILLVEQNVGAAAILANTAYVLRDGEIAYSGPAEELISNHEVLSSYLGN
jgi:branched-chain amino acid transport system ATP-binding protein